MVTCIPPGIIEQVKKLNLENMSSLQRIKALEDLMGNKQAKEINNLFEKSLLLKNQDTAFAKFIDNIDGISVKKKAILKEQIAKRMADKKEIIKDKELSSFIGETLSKKYDVEIPDEVVEQLFKIKKEASSLEELAKGTADGSVEKLNWGLKLREYTKIINKLQDTSGDNLLSVIKTSLRDSKIRIAQQKGGLGKVGQTLSEIVRSVFGLPAKGILAAWDASMLFRQGLKVLSASPKIWGKQGKGALKSWKRVYNKELMEEVTDAFYADMTTRDLYQEALKSGLSLGVVEDFFPTNVAEKIPFVGNLFKASDDSFTMFLQGSRMDLFEKYVKVLKEGGETPSEEVLKSLADHINGLTGRGGLGKGEASSGFLNQVFFSIRYQIANLKTFTDPLLSKTPEVRKLAAKNLAKHTAMIGGIMTTLAAVTDVGFDPKSSTFGKARIPGSKKWVDVTGGLASYIAVIGKSYDALQKKPKYGQRTALDIGGDFLKGKLAPVPGAMRDFLDQRDFRGNKPTALSTLRGLFTPISANNVIWDIQEQEDAIVLGLSLLFEILGSGVSEPRSKREGSYPAPFKIR